MKKQIATAKEKPLHEVCTIRPDKCLIPFVFRKYFQPGHKVMYLKETVRKDMVGDDEIFFIDVIDIEKKTPKPVSLPLCMLKFKRWQMKEISQVHDVPRSAFLKCRVALTADPQTDEDETPEEGPTPLEVKAFACR